MKFNPILVTKVYIAFQGMQYFLSAVTMVYFFLRLFRAISNS